MNLTTVGWVEVDDELGIYDSVCESIIEGEFSYYIPQAGRVGVGSAEIDLPLNILQL